MLGDGSLYIDSVLFRRIGVFFFTEEYIGINGGHKGYNQYIGNKDIIRMAEKRCNDHHDQRREYPESLPLRRCVFVQMV